MSELTGFYICEGCRTRVYEGTEQVHEGQLLCENCYLEANR